MDDSQIIPNDKLKFDGILSAQNLRSQKPPHGVGKPWRPPPIGVLRIKDFLEEWKLPGGFFASFSSGG